MLVTGGTGMLGAALVPALLDAGHSVQVLSRREAPAVPEGATARRGDVLTGDGLAAAFDGADVVVHAASSPFRKTRATEVDGTRHVLAAATDAGAGHVLYPSIVGVDDHPLAYYRAKREAETVVEASEIPWTIARATQFHGLLDGFVRSAARFPVVPLMKGFLFQPVAAEEYAAELVRLVEAGPAGRAPDTGGPEVIEQPEIVRTWLQTRGKRRLTLRLPTVGKIARAIKDGAQICPGRAVGTVTWIDYLARS